MNINKNVSGNCKKKCEYSFDYPLTNLVARNKGDHITFRPDTQRVSPVRYNQEKYDVKVMKLYRSSVHSFGGSSADAELMIEHVGVTTGGRLMVCIPVMATSSSDTTLDKMIQGVSKFAPTAGGNAGEISIPGFSLSSLVPKKPYYSYTGALPSSGMGSYKYDIIVFSKEHALPISTSGRKVLKNMISAHKHSVIRKNTGVESFFGGRVIEGFDHEEPPDVFFNQNGPNTDGNGKDEIYIDCQPTGASEEKTLVDAPMENSDYSEYSETTNKMIQVLIGFAYFFIGIFVVYIVYRFVDRFRKNNSSSSTASTASTASTPTTASTN